MHEQLSRRKTRTTHRSGNDGAVLKPYLEKEVLFTLDETLQLIADRAVAVTGADGMAIALPDNDEIVLRTASGAVRPDLGACIDRDSAFSGACLRTAQILSCDDTERDARVNRETCRRLGVRSMVAVPLSERKHRIGLLQAFSAHPFGFDDSDVHNLSILADLVLASLTHEDEPVPLPVAATTWEAPPGKPEATAVASSQMPRLRESAASRFGMPVLVLCIVIASSLSGRVLWRLKSPQFAKKAVRAEKTARRATGTVEMNAPGSPSATPAAPSGNIRSSKTPDEMLATVSPAKPQDLSDLPLVSGIQYQSSTDSTIVSLNLGGQVQYDAHRLANPHRIYFDLHRTQLGSSLAFKTIPVGDALLRRIRIAESVTGTTRIVLETKMYSDFSVNLVPNPFRLVVEVRNAGTGPKAR